MSEKEMKKHGTLNVTVRNSILDAIKRNIETEKNVNLSNLGDLSGALDQLAARDLYSKGSTGDNYSKNTKRVGFDDQLPADLGQLPGKPRG